MYLYQLSILSDYLIILVKNLMNLAIVDIKVLKKQFTSMFSVEQEKLDEELRPLEKLTQKEQAILEEFYSAEAWVVDFVV